MSTGIVPVLGHACTMGRRGGYVFETVAVPLGLFPCSGKGLSGHVDTKVPNDNTIKNCYCSRSWLVYLREQFWDKSREVNKLRLLQKACTTFLCCMLMATSFPRIWRGPYSSRTTD